jgi:hypothetical protein
MGGRFITCNPDGTQIVHDDRNLAEARAEAIERIKFAYAAKIASGMPFMGSVLQIDSAAVQNMTAVRLQIALSVPLPSGFAWRMADNTMLSLDEDGVAAMTNAALAYVHGLRAGMWAAVDAAAAAEDIAAADAAAAAWPPAF